MGFDSKVAIVTGATGGIGQQLVAELIGQGARVVVTGRDARSCAVLEERHGAHLSALPGDIPPPGTAKRWWSMQSSSSADCTCYSTTLEPYRAVPQLKPQTRCGTALLP